MRNAAPLKFVSVRGKSNSSSRTSVSSSEKNDRIKIKGPDLDTRNVKEIKTNNSSSSSGSVSVDIDQFTFLIEELYNNSNVLMMDLNEDLKSKLQAVDLLTKGNNNQMLELEAVITKVFSEMNINDVKVGTVASYFLGYKKKAICLVPLGCNPYGAVSRQVGNEENGFSSCEHDVFILRNHKDGQILNRVSEGTKKHHCIIHAFDGIKKLSDEVVKSLTDEYKMTHHKMFLITEYNNGQPTKCDPLFDGEFTELIKNESNHHGVEKTHHDQKSNNYIKKKESWSWFSILILIVILMILGFLIYLFIKPSYGHVLESNSVPKRYLKKNRNKSW